MRHIHTRFHYYALIAVLLLGCQNLHAGGKMVEFDLKLLDKWSYGLGRSYNNCPNYSDETTHRIIESHLSKLPKETEEP